MGRRELVFQADSRAELHVELSLQVQHCWKVFSRPEQKVLQTAATWKRGKGLTAQQHIFACKWLANRNLAPKPKDPWSMFQNPFDLLLPTASKLDSSAFQGKMQYQIKALRGFKRFRWKLVPTFLTPMLMIESLNVSNLCQCYRHNWLCFVELGER